MAFPPSRRGPLGPPPIDSSLPGSGDGATSAPAAPPVPRPPEAPADFVPPPRARTNSDAEVRDSHEAKAPRFWTNQFNAGLGFKTDPKFRYRFRVIFPGLTIEDDRSEDPYPGERAGADDRFFDREAQNEPYVWWVKTISKPKLDYQTEEEKFSTAQDLLSKRVSGRPILGDITMTMVDPSYPNATRKLARIVRRTGYNEAQAQGIIRKYYDNSYTKSHLDILNGPERKGVQIHQLDEFGRRIETWTLHNAFIKRIDFGELDYSSDELLEISLTLGYEAVKVFFPDYGREKAYTYFKDVEPLPQEPPNKSDERDRCNKIYTDRVKKGVTQAVNFDEWIETLPENNPCKRLAEQPEPGSTDNPTTTAGAPNPESTAPGGADGTVPVNDADMPPAGAAPE